MIFPTKNPETIPAIPAEPARKRSGPFDPYPEEPAKPPRRRFYLLGGGWYDVPLDERGRPLGGREGPAA